MAEVLTKAHPCLPTLLEAVELRLLSHPAVGILVQFWTMGQYLAGEEETMVKLGTAFPQMSITQP